MSNKSVININCLSFLGPTTCTLRHNFKQPIKGDSAEAPNGLLLNIKRSKGAAALSDACTLEKYRVSKEFKATEGPKLSLNEPFRLQKKTHLSSTVTPPKQEDLNNKCGIFHCLAATCRLLTAVKGHTQSDDMGANGKRGQGSRGAALHKCSVMCFPGSWLLSTLEFANKYPGRLL